MDSTRKRETKRLLDKLEMESQFENKKRELKEVREQQKKLLELKDKTTNNMRVTENLEAELKVKSKQLDLSNKERDKLERELASQKSELAGMKRVLELERQERRELETKALNLIKGAKRKWEATERDKIAQLNKHIESQTLRITELCTSNNEMSSRLQRAESELETANAELNKLRVFQAQQKESLSKLRELNRQSTQGVENKLEQIANRAHNQLADLRARLEVEQAKSADLELKLRNEQDTNHCRQSRLNVALELTQSELKDAQEQLRSLKATIPARDAEMETLKKQLSEKTKLLENTINSEQYMAQMTEHMERLKLENDQLRQQLESTKCDLNDTIVHLEQNENLSMNLEKAAQDKASLERRLKQSLEKEEEHLKKVGSLEELLRRLENSVSKLEAENIRLKRKTKELEAGGSRASTSFAELEVLTKSSANVDESVKRLEEQLKSAKEALTAERKNAREAQFALYKKEKELSDANLDKRIATRQAKSAEDKIKKLEEEKQKLQERINKKVLDEEERLKDIKKELESTKTSLTESSRECSRHKIHAESAQRALTQANKQIEELQSSSAALRRELDSTRKQLRSSQDRMDSLKQENERLALKVSKHGEVTNGLEAKLEKLQEELTSYQVNNELLRETCTVLEEQLTDYERLTSDHEFRENTLIQEKMKLQKDLEATEGRLREATAAQNEEKTMRLVAERAIQRLESETSDIEEERNSLASQRDQYKKMAQQLSKQVAELTAKCGELECDLSGLQRALETAKGEARVVKEESSQHLTKMHELREENTALMEDLQDSVDQGQQLRERVFELEAVLEEMRQFYNEREMKAGSTQQQQTKLIDYLQLKLEECSKSKKTFCDKLFGSKQKENVPPIGTAMPVGYRELENQLEQERERVKALTEQLLTVKATKATAPVLSTPSSPEPKVLSENTNSNFNRQASLQRMRHNIPHRFNISLPMRTAKCVTCLDSIQFGRKAAICSECQIMAHLKCSSNVPATCGIPGLYARKMKDTWKNSDESLTSTVESIQTLALDEPDIPVKESSNNQNKSENNKVLMESWVKVPGRSKSCWERKYLRLEGSCLCTYEHQPSAGMSPISRLDLSEKDGYAILENVDQAEVAATAKSDLPFILRVESNSSTTCWPTTRLDIMALSQKDKKEWLKSLMSVPSKALRIEKYQRVLRLAKNQLDLNCAVELPDEKVLLLGAEDGLFSYKTTKSNVLTAIRGVKKVHQLTLHPQLNLALMIAGEDRQLVSCDLRQLKSNALAAECSRPAINIREVLTDSESCHLYQVQGEMLCAATATHVILMNWIPSENSGEFIGVRELETQEPCSCALFTANKLIIGCHKFFQIDVNTYDVEEFPEDDDNSVKATILGVAKLGIFPVCVLDVSESSRNVELLLCYNEFGVFVDGNGKRTRNVDPTWSHLPFAFAFRKPYLFIVHFSSVEIIKIDTDTYKTSANKPEKTLIELSNPRFLGLAGQRGIYVAAINSTLEILKIEGVQRTSAVTGSLTSLDALSQNGDDTSEFSFTSSLMEALDGQTKRVHFANY